MNEAIENATRRGALVEPAGSTTVTPLEVIGNSLYRYIDVASEALAAVGEGVGVHVGVHVGVGEEILVLLRRDPTLSARELATLLSRTSRTVERHLKLLRDRGLLRRVGSDKAGHWEVVGGVQ